MSLNADNYRLCKVKATHNAVLAKNDASLEEKTFTSTKAPHLDTRPFITKQDDVAKTSDLDVPMTLAEQIKGPVFGTIWSWQRKGISLHPKSPKPQQSKELLWYGQTFERPLRGERQLVFLYWVFRKTGRRELTTMPTTVAFPNFFQTRTL